MYHRAARVDLGRRTTDLPISNGLPVVGDYAAKARFFSDG